MAALHAPRRILENFVVVWVDPNIDKFSADYQYSIDRLRQIVSSIEIFTYIDDCIDYVNNNKNEKVFMIVSGSLGQQLVPGIHDISNLYAVYVFCADQTVHKTWISEYQKIKGLFTQIEPLCDHLKRDIDQVDNNLTPISIVSPSFTLDLNQLDQSFMYSQLLKEIILKINNDENAKKDFVRFCREQCAENDSRLAVIEEFEKDYNPTLSVRWYTRDCFIYSMLNKALRTQEIDVILKMSFFIRDLHQHIEQIYSNTSYSNKLTLYRGQGMNSGEFEKLRKSKDGLLSFNNFLSTSYDPNVGNFYADCAQQNPELVGVVFQIEIDPLIDITPFASLHDQSYFAGEEGEVLFSMHTVFRIGEINEIGSRLWKVKLVLTNDQDKDLKHLTNYIRKEIKDETEWNQLVRLMLKMGEFNKAEEIYRATLKSTSAIDTIDDPEVQHTIGFITSQKGDKKSALSFYERALSIQEKSLPFNHLDIAVVHSNIGEVRLSMGEYTTALDHFNKALTIQIQSLPENHLSLACTYNNLGSVYWMTGEYPNSLRYLKKALEISQEHLPWNHPELGRAHNNIGEVYESMGEYYIAVSYYEKALEIRKKTLPPNHPDLASSYNNIGEMYQVMGQWLTALTHFKKALEIQQISLPPNHPDLAILHNNIGEAYRSMEKYSDALSHYEQALQIQQNSLPLNHPDLARMYNNIGLAQGSLRNYADALSNYEKALEIQRSTLSFNHPDIALVHNNIGLVCQSMGDNAAALSYFHKTLDIQQQCLSIDHPDLGKTHNNIGMIHLLIGNNSSALLHLKKALEIWQKSFPSRHPHLLILHAHISVAYRTLHQYEDAVRHELMAMGIDPPDSASVPSQLQIFEEELD